MTLEPSKLKVRCPSCKKWSPWGDNPFRPFCSEECKGRDLGNWATEKYRVPVEEDPASPTTDKKGEE